MLLCVSQFYYVKKLFIIIVFYDTTARCLKFRTMKKNYYRLNLLQKVFCFYENLIGRNHAQKKIACIKIIAGL